VNPNFYKDVEFEVFAAVKIQIMIFWIVTPGRMLLFWGTLLQPSSQWSGQIQDRK